MFVFAAGAVKIVKGHKKSLFSSFIIFHRICDTLRHSHTAWQTSKAIYRYLIVCSAHLCPYHTDCFSSPGDDTEKMSPWVHFIGALFDHCEKCVCECVWFELHFDPGFTRFEPRKMVFIPVFTSPTSIPSCWSWLIYRSISRLYWHQKQKRPG